MEFEYAAEIAAARVGVVILPTNNDGAKGWERRLLVAKEAIEDQIRRRRRPYVLRVSLSGELTQIKLYRKRQNRVIKIRSSKAD